MSPFPLVLGLTLCEKAIVEEGTKNVTLVSTFTKLTVEEFPSSPQRFVLYTVLTEGLGQGTMDLVIRNLETNAEVFSLQVPVSFPDRVIEARVLLRINRCVFPVEGEHLCTLLLDGEWLGQRRLRVVKKEE
jgi:hypothetical protein